MNTTKQTARYIPSHYGDTFTVNGDTFRYIGMSMDNVRGTVISSQQLPKHATVQFPPDTHFQRAA